MKYKKVDDTFVVSIARGEEIIATLVSLVEQEDITLGSIQGIGAAEQIELGYYNVSDQEYSTQLFEGEYEIVNLTGNISSMNDEPYVHAHITLGDKNFTAHAGHLVQATVSGACELIIQAVPGNVDRQKDTEVTGLNLLKI